MLLDLEALDDDALFDDIDPLELVLARASGRHVAKVLVGGRLAVDGGRVLGIDEPALRAELLARMRAALAADPSHAQWRRTLGALAEDLGPLYREGRIGRCCG